MGRVRVRAALEIFRCRVHNIASEFGDSATHRLDPCLTYTFDLDLLNRLSSGCLEEKDTVNTHIAMRALVWLPLLGHVVGAIDTNEVRYRLVARECDDFLAKGVGTDHASL